MKQPILNFLTAINTTLSSFASFDLMATIETKKTQFLLLHNLLAIINGLLLECSSFPFTMDTVLQWSFDNDFFNHRRQLQNHCCDLLDFFSWNPLWACRDQTLILSCYSKSTRVQLPAFRAKYTTPSR